MKFVGACSVSLVAILFCVPVTSTTAVSASKFQHLEEWLLWKDEHRKEYLSEKVLKKNF